MNHHRSFPHGGANDHEVQLNEVFSPQSYFGYAIASAVGGGSGGGFGSIGPVLGNVYGLEIERLSSTSFAFSVREGPYGPAIVSTTQTITGIPDPLYIQLWNGNSDAFFPQVQIAGNVNLPEPASISLIGFIGLGLFVRGRRTAR
jgi:hypothetical protein